MIKYYLIALFFSVISLNGISSNFAQSKNDSLNKIEYEKIIAEADSICAIATQSGNIEQIRLCYQLNAKAYQIYPFNSFPQVKLEIMFSKFQEGCGNYLGLINKANELFEKKDHENALKLYDRAHSLKPSDPFNVQRINEIENLLKNINK